MCLKSYAFVPKYAEEPRHAGLAAPLLRNIHTDMQDDELATFAPWNEDVQKACKNK